MPLSQGTKAGLVLSESQVTKSSKQCALPQSAQGFVLYASSLKNKYNDDAVVKKNKKPPKNPNQKAPTLLH